MRERVSSLVPIKIDSEELVQTQKERASSCLAVLNDSEENLFSANKDRFIVRPRINVQCNKDSNNMGNKFTRISSIALINPEEQFNPTTSKNGTAKR